MLDLLKQKDSLLAQLHHYADTLGLSHPYTVKKSQELDVVVNKIVFQDSQIVNLDLQLEKRAS